jgi:hypothetical protein
MTTADDLPKLFNFDPATKRIVAFAGSVALSSNGDDPATAATFTLLDPKTKARTDKWLFVALSPGDALRLATSIFQHAKQHQWPLGDLGEMVQVEVGGDPKKKH